MRFGYGRRSTQEKLRVAEALEQLPVLALELQEGALSWSAARELTRVAAPETERAWLEVAHGKTVRQLEELVAGKREGDTPDSPPNHASCRHVLRFEVTAETFALVRQALGEIRRRTVASVDDDAALLEMARHALGSAPGASAQESSAERGRASYQIAVTQCAECGVASQEANGELVRVGSEIVAMASCDAQHLGRVDFQPANDATSDGLPTSGTHAAGRERAHVGARAKQSVPPSVRRVVLRRDHQRCRIPGCRNATFLDVHHIQLRSEGGDHGADNLLTVCGAHHRALHRGELSIEGTDAASVRFRHADGAPYGEAADPRAVDVQAKVFGGLRNLGFRDGDIRRVLASCVPKPS